MTTSKDTVMIRLLDACVTVLREQGMNRVFLDAVRGGYEGFQSMGKHYLRLRLIPMLIFYSRLPKMGDI